MTTDLGLDYFSPSSPLGLFILVIGGSFTSLMFYVLLSLNKDSLGDQRAKEMKRIIQVQKIKRLYPKKRR